MTVIHMETEQVRELDRRYGELYFDINEQIHAIIWSLDRLSMDWTGDSATIFQEDCNNWKQHFDTHMQTLVTLMGRLRRELEEWEQADSNFGGSSFSNVEVTWDSV